MCQHGRKSMTIVVPFKYGMKPTAVPIHDDWLRVAIGEGEKPAHHYTNNLHAYPQHRACEAHTVREG